MCESVWFKQIETRGFCQRTFKALGICESQISVCIEMYHSEQSNIFIHFVQTPLEGNQSHKSEANLNCFWSAFGF